MFLRDVWCSSSSFESLWIGSLQGFYSCLVDSIGIYIKVKYYLRRFFWGEAIVVCRDMQILLVQFDSNLNIPYLLYLGWFLISWAKVLCLNGNILHRLFYYSLNIPYLLYIGWCLTSWANVLCLNASILYRLFYYSLNIQYLLYIDGCFASWANVLCLNANILHRLFYSHLNILHFLPRLMFYKLGQCALLTWKHPSSPMLFLAKYSIFFT